MSSDHMQGTAEGDVVVTWNHDRSQILAVTRQDREGRILKVIAQTQPQPKGTGDETFACRCQVERRFFPAADQAAGDWDNGPSAQSPAPEDGHGPKCLKGMLEDDEGAKHPCTCGARKPPTRGQLFTALNEVAELIGDCEEWAITEDPQVVVSMVKDYMAGVSLAIQAPAPAPGALSGEQLDGIRQALLDTANDPHDIEEADRIVERILSSFEAAGRRQHPYGLCTITGPDEDVAFIFRHLPDVDSPAPAVAHPDDAAVDALAAAMKAKLADARAKGRSGWQTCPPEELSLMLREHVEKGDPRDVANFCAFLFALGQGISLPPVGTDNFDLWVSRGMGAKRAAAPDDAELERLFCERVGLDSINPEAVDTRRSCLWFAKGYRAALSQPPVQHKGGA